MLDTTQSINSSGIEKESTLHLVSLLPGGALTQIFVKTLTGRVIRLNIASLEVIAEVKLKIQESTR